MSRSADRRISFTAKLLISLSLSLTLSLSLPLSLWIPFSHPVSSYSSNPIFLTTCLLLLHCKTSYLHTLPQISTPTNFLPPLGRRYFYPQPPVRAPSFYITVLRPCLRHFCLSDFLFLIIRPSISSFRPITFQFCFVFLLTAEIQRKEKPLEVESVFSALKWLLRVCLMRRRELIILKA